MSVFGKIPMKTHQVPSRAEQERLMQQWQASQSMTTMPLSFEAWLEGHQQRNADAAKGTNSAGPGVPTSAHAGPPGIN